LTNARNFIVVSPLGLTVSVGPFVPVPIRRTTRPEIDKRLGLARGTTCLANILRVLADGRFQRQDRRQCRLAGDVDDLMAQAERADGAQRFRIGLSHDPL
jgi:hypothetical protein